MMAGQIFPEVETVKTCQVLFALSKQPNVKVLTLNLWWTVTKGLQNNRFWRHFRPSLKWLELQSTMHTRPEIGWNPVSVTKSSKESIREGWKASNLGFLNSKGRIIGTQKRINDRTTLSRGTKKRKKIWRQGRSCGCCKRQHLIKTSGFWQMDILVNKWK